MASHTLTKAEKKARGAHYTPPALASFVAGEIADAVAAGSGPFQRLTVLDPAVGDGSLLEAIATQLAKRGIGYECLIGCDTSALALASAQVRLRCFSAGGKVELIEADFVEASRRSSDEQCDFLSGETMQLSADVVIANPPYVRTQILGARRAQALSQAYDIGGRVDLYFAFLRGIARILAPGGIAGVIVSNRFMTTRAGAGVRRWLRHEFEIIRVIDFGDTKLFEAAVLPVVLLLRRRSPSPSPLRAGFSSIYSAPRAVPEARAENVFQALTMEGAVLLPSGDVFEVRHGELDEGETSESVWRMSSASTDTWLERVLSRTDRTFADIGPIRVGLKTTADKVFIKSDWDELPEDEQPEVLRPLITHHVAQRFRARELDRPVQVLYTHCVEGGRRVAIDLNRFPRAARYLERHRSRLEQREYVRNAGRKWYEIWVPQDPEGWGVPKLVFRDIAEVPTFWLDLDGSVVNGDCYWLSAQPDTVDLLFLAMAVANSTFIEAFYDSRFNNKLYAGRRRFITQYVAQFPLPDPSSAISQRMVALARETFLRTPSDEADALAAELNDLTWNAFGLRPEERPR